MLLVEVRRLDIAPTTDQFWTIVSRVNGPEFMGVLYRAREAIFDSAGITFTIDLLNKFLTNDAIIACDCGTVTTWAARHIQMRDQMRFSVSGLLATMAEGLPYAIGAAAGYPGRQVVAVVGDEIGRAHV